MKKITFNFIIFVESSRNYSHHIDLFAFSISIELFLYRKMCTHSLNIPSISKSSFFWKNSTNYIVQHQNLKNVEINNYFFRSNIYSSWNEFHQMFSSNSTLMVFSIDFRNEIEYCIILFHLWNILSRSNSLIIVKSLTKINEIDGRVSFLKSFK